MNSSKAYLFTSARLGFRNWHNDDVETMAQMNSDPEVMKFFPALQSHQETRAFIIRMQEQFERNGFCYFAVDRLDTTECIGFIGLSEKNFEAEFTPCIDIGWRIKRSQWNQGFATEGAKRCLQYGFQNLNLKKIVAMAPAVNIKSEQVMQKIGMQKLMNFQHPLLQGNDRLQNCVLYELSHTE